MGYLQVSKTGMTTSLRLGSETAFEFDQLEVSLVCIAMMCHLMAIVQEPVQAGHCAAAACNLANIVSALRQNGCILGKTTASHMACQAQAKHCVLNSMISISNMPGRSHGHIIPELQTLVCISQMHLPSQV